MPPSRLLFHLPCEPKLEKLWDPMACTMKLAIIIGFDVFISGVKPQGVEASAEVTEYGPYILAVKKFRDPEAEELRLK